MDEALFKGVEYGECPRQLNGFDCGLFAVGVVLHLVEGKQDDHNGQGITNLRAKLAAIFGENGTGLGTTSQVVRACFPKLNGNSILDTFGVEVLGMPAAEVHQLRSGRSLLRSGGGLDGDVTVMTETEIAEQETSAIDTVHNLESDEDMETTVEKSTSLLSAVDDDDLASDNDALSYHTCEDSKCSNEPKNDNVTDLRTGNDDRNLGKPAPVKSPDTLFYDVMRDAKVDCFATLEEAMPFIEAYEI